MKIDPFKVEEWMNKFEIGATALVHYDFLEREGVWICQN